jgi:hypothetical protein
MKAFFFAPVVLFALACAGGDDPEGGGGAGADGPGGSPTAGGQGGVGASGAGGAGGAGASGGAGAAPGGGAPGAGGESAGGDPSGGGGCDPSACQVDLSSIQSFPDGATTLNFETCTGACACCDANGAYADPITNGCVECSIDAALAAEGITRSGGSGTYFVSCITGNASAPIQGAALFAGGSTVELELAQPATFFGFTGLPSSSDSLPTVTLEGYNAAGELTGLDSFSFVTPGGDCATSNPAAQFFAFRACCGPMVRAVVTFSDANTGIDSLTTF